MLNPDELEVSDRKGELGVAYLHAVASAAGYAVTVRRLDRDCVDVTVHPGTGRRTGLDFQVKCTAQPAGPAHGTFSYRVDQRTYNRLRLDTTYPRYLLVVTVPKSPDNWIRVSHRRLNFRHCGLWTSLHGMPPTTNSTVTVSLDRANVLTPAALQQLVVKAQLL
jgi:hypothetical protein